MNPSVKAKEAKKEEISDYSNFGEWVFQSNLIPPVGVEFSLGMW